MSVRPGRIGVAWAAVHGEIDLGHRCRPASAVNVGVQLASAGMRATMRMLVVSSSICSHGRR